MGVEHWGQLTLPNRHLLWERRVKPRGFDEAEQKKQRQQMKGKVGRVDPPGYSCFCMCVCVKSLLLRLGLHPELEWLHHQRPCTAPGENQSLSWAGNAQGFTKVLSNCSPNLGRWDHKWRQRAGVGEEGAALSICWHLSLQTSDILLGATEKSHVVPQIQHSFSINNSHTIILKLN